MERIIESYKRCLGECPPNSSCICRYVCQDKFRQKLGGYAMSTGENTLGAGKTVQWPFVNSNFTPVKQYINVNDLDCDFKFQQNGPFSIPKRAVTGGCLGQKNRAYPYNFVYRDGYGSLMKFTRPSSTSPIYY